MEETAEILKKLNEEQIQPVLTTEGAVLVLAGAGSGKTRVLTSRIAYLLNEKRVPSEAILAITFTNKAAAEMKERIEKLAHAERMWVCTIHSMCVRILRMFPEEAGIHKNFSIYSETERSNIIKKSFQECDYSDEKLLKSIKWHIANAKMLGYDPDRYAVENCTIREIDDIIKVYRRYVAHLNENNALDFDDLLNETRNLLQRNDEVRTYLGGRFRYILVDEFQDTNAVQYEIIKLLSLVHGNIFAVGDDDQSIYGWRGAKIENILHFSKDFKGAKTFKLERNYRSTKKILSAANAVIQFNCNRNEKTLWTENDEGEAPKVFEAEEENGEARFVAHTIAGLMNKGYKYSDFAVLMRLNALTRAFEQEFASDGIPYKVFGGFKFYERKEIKDLLAYLRIINNPFDSEAIVRIINFPKRGIGLKTIEILEKYAYENELTVYDSLLDVDEMGFSGSTKQKLQGFAGLIKKWIMDSLELSVSELVKEIVEDTAMREAYADDSDESINKRANIDEFINSVDEYCKLNEEATLADYLNQISLSSDTDDMDDGNYVTLATIHSVKGLEFRSVFISGLEENILPVSRAMDNDDDMEEERRLMYVAITRAKERLYLTRSKSRYLYGKREPTERSKFLKELSSVVELPKEKNIRPSFEWKDDDPEFYGNSTYGSTRYSSFGSSRSSNYGSSSSYGNSSYRSVMENSTIKRSAWNGKAYSSSASYGASHNSTTSSNASGGFTYGKTGNIDKPKSSGVDVSAYHIGVKVNHPKFGVGTIISIKNAGANMIIDVAFEKMGIKQLSAALAPLTIID